jgi:hypothetical protein
MSMPPVGIEPTISAEERPQTYALDGAATGTGFGIYFTTYKLESPVQLISQYVIYSEQLM